MLEDRADLIFMAGFDDDAIRLAHAFGLALSLNPIKNRSLANITGPDAAIARAFPQDMRRLIFSSFSSSSEWTLEHVPLDKQPAFFSDWLSTYYRVDNSDTSEFSIDDHAMLTYDAFQAIVDAITLIHGSVTGETVRTALTSLGSSSIPAFQGVSGCISFDNLGNSINKHIVILDIEDVGGGNKAVLKQVIGNLKCAR